MGPATPLGGARLALVPLVVSLRLATQTGVEQLPSLCVRYATTMNDDT
jgi:hypothetical protein